MSLLGNWPWTLSQTRMRRSCPCWVTDLEPCLKLEWDHVLVELLTLNLVQNQNETIKSLLSYWPWTLSQTRMRQVHVCPCWVTDLEPFPKPEWDTDLEPCPKPEWKDLVLVWVTDLEPCPKPEWDTDLEPCPKPEWDDLVLVELLTLNLVPNQNETIWSLLSWHHTYSTLNTMGSINNWSQNTKVYSKSSPSWIMHYSSTFLSLRLKNFTIKLRVGYVHVSTIEGWKIFKCKTAVPKTGHLLEMNAKIDLDTLTLSSQFNLSGLRQVRSLNDWIKMLPLSHPLG